jgi:choline-glycine betaine transporter
MRPLKKRLHRVVVVTIPIGGAIFGFTVVMLTYAGTAVFFNHLTTIVNNSIALALSVSAIINILVVRRMFKKLRYDAYDMLKDIMTLDTEDPELTREAITQADAEPINISRRRNAI